VGESGSKEKRVGERLGEEPSYQPEGYQKKEKEPRPAYRPVQPVPQKERSPLVRVILVIVLLGAAFGGYYLFCRYKVGNQIWQMDLRRKDLKAELSRLGRDIVPQDVKNIALQIAKKTGVEANPEHIVVYIAALDNENVKKLPPVQAEGFRIADSVVTAKKNVWIVGFEGRFLARYGICKKYFLAKRYTWFQLVKETTH
jgi:hypothetical protein